MQRYRVSLAQLTWKDSTDLCFSNYGRRIKYIVKSQKQSWKLYFNSHWQCLEVTPSPHVDARHQRLISCVVWISPTVKYSGRSWHSSFLVAFLAYSLICLHCCALLSHWCSLDSAIVAGRADFWSAAGDDGGSATYVQLALADAEQLAAAGLVVVMVIMRMMMARMAVIVRMFVMVILIVIF